MRTAVGSLRPLRRGAALLLAGLLGLAAPATGTAQTLDLGAIQRACTDPELSFFERAPALRAAGLKGGRQDLAAALRVSGAYRLLSGGLALSETLDGANLSRSGSIRTDDLEDYLLFHLGGNRGKSSADLMSAKAGTGPTARHWFATEDGFVLLSYTETAFSKVEIMVATRCVVILGKSQRGEFSAEMPSGFVTSREASVRTDLGRLTIANAAKSEPEANKTKDRLEVKSLEVDLASDFALLLSVRSVDTLIQTELLTSEFPQ